MIREDDRLEGVEMESVDFDEELYLQNMKDHDFPDREGEGV